MTFVVVALLILVLIVLIDAQILESVTHQPYKARYHFDRAARNAAARAYIPLIESGALEATEACRSYEREVGASYLCDPGGYIQAFFDAELRYIHARYREPWES